MLPVKRRGFLLAFFEAMGKWSNIDSLMIFILMAAMKMDFTIPPSPPAPLDPELDSGPPAASVMVEVMPTEGISYFMLAVVISFVPTALAFHMHKTVALPPSHPCARTPRTKRNQGAKVSVPETFRGCSTICGRTGIWTNLFVSLSLLVALGVTAGACFLPVFRLSKGGLLGVVLGDAATEDYSVIDSGLGLRTASPASFGWLMEAYCYAYFVMIMGAPLLWYTLAFFCWVVPLTPTARHILGLVLNICFSFSALEVYLVCMILSLMQLDSIAQQIVGEMSVGMCEAAGAVLEKHFGDLVEPPTCLTLSSGVLLSYFLLCPVTLIGIPAGMTVASKLEASALDGNKRQVIPGGHRWATMDEADLAAEMRATSQPPKGSKGSVGRGQSLVQSGSSVSTML